MPAMVYYSADDVRALPDDGNRYETVHGELLVSPAPRPVHQVVLMNLTATLTDYLRRHQLHGLMNAAADVSWGDDTLVQPDLFVGELDAALRSNDWRDLTTLHLVVEILSPSSLRADRFTKRRLYQERRIPAYWVVDIDHAQVEVWTPDAQFPAVETESLRWRHPQAPADCVIALDAIFPPRTS